MSSWSQRRKSIYLSFFALFLFGFIILPAYLIFHKPPTCSDGKQNGTEEGVDCGGNCANLCRSQYLDPNVIWARTINVKQGIYSALAYVENPNIDAGADSISYVFKIKDKDGILIYERKGKTFVPPSKFFAIFEDGIFAGERIPTKVIFEFTSDALWQKKENKDAGIIVTKKTVSRADYAPRIDATLENVTIEPISRIEAIAIAYGEDGNALGFSRTFIDELNKGESRDVVFTWPKPFDSDVVKIEIIPKIHGQK